MQSILRGWSFGAGEAENPVDAQIFGKRGSSGSPVQALGGVLAIAAQRPPNRSRNWLGRMQTLAQHSQQPVAYKAPEKLVIERDDRFVAAGVALPAGAPEELAVDATRLVIFCQDDM